MEIIDEVIKENLNEIKQKQIFIEALKMEMTKLEDAIKFISEKCDNIKKGIRSNRSVLSFITEQKATEKLRELLDTMQEYNKKMIAVKDCLIDLENLIEYKSDQLKDLYNIKKNQVIKNADNESIK